MRTILTIDDDVLLCARKIAAAEKKSVGQVISSLARRGLSPAKTETVHRNGVPLLKVRTGANRVTSDFVHRLCENLP